MAVAIGLSNRAQGPAVTIAMAVAIAIVMAVAKVVCLGDFGQHNKRESDINRTLNTKADFAAKSAAYHKSIVSWTRCQV